MTAELRNNLYGEKWTAEQVLTKLDPPEWAARPGRDLIETKNFIEEQVGVSLKSAPNRLLHESVPDGTYVIIRLDRAPDVHVLRGDVVPDGHVFIAEKADGVVRYRCPQSDETKWLNGPGRNTTKSPYLDEAMRRFPFPNTYRVVPKTD